MKKLLAAGEERIFAFSHVWRNRERGALHSPEFTMLEWYRAGEDYRVLFDDCAQYLRHAAEVAGAELLRFRGAECDPYAAPEVMSVARRSANMPASTCFRLATGPKLIRGPCARRPNGRGSRTAPDDGWSDILSRALVERSSRTWAMAGP